MRVVCNYTVIEPHAPIASQTRIWEGRTNLSECVFEELYAPQTKILEGLTIVIVEWRVELTTR